MHRAVGQLLLDRIDLAVKPIPELSAHLQGMPIRIDYLIYEKMERTTDSAKSAAQYVRGAY